MGWLGSASSTELWNNDVDYRKGPINSPKKAKMRGGYEGRVSEMAHLAEGMHTKCLGHV